MSDPDDFAVFLSALDSFKCYEHSSINDYIVKRRLKLAATHSDYAAFLEPRFAELENAFALNAKITEKLVEIGEDMVNALFPNRASDDSHSIDTRATEADQLKVRSTLKQLVREWSSYSSRERNVVFEPILEALALKLDLNATVVCPGSGLGRLPFEIAKLGFHAVGNEISPHMLFASKLMLDTAEQPNEFVIAPFAHTFSGHRTADSQLQQVCIPDIAASTCTNSGNIAMAIGEFCESFFNAESKDSADAVVTSFFLDTSADIFKTIETITHITKPNGYWVNCGPLSWHFENCDEGGLELNMEDIYILIESLGWVVETQRSIESTYCANLSSMIQTKYDCEFFVAQKKSGDER